MKYFNLSVLLVLSTVVFAQSVTITNGLKEKTFKPESQYTILFGEQSEKENCCNSTVVEGSIKAVTKDSIEVLVSSLVTRKVSDDFTIVNTNTSKAGYLKTFAQKDIYNLSHYKSKRSKKRKNSFIVMGSLLLFSGLVTTANYLAVKKDSSKKTLLYTGGLEVGLGIGILLFTKKKTYAFKKNTPNWYFK